MRVGVIYLFWMLNYRTTTLNYHMMLRQVPRSKFSFMYIYNTKERSKFSRSFKNNTLKMIGILALYLILVKFKNLSTEVVAKMEVKTIITEIFQSATYNLN